MKCFRVQIELMPDGDKFAAVHYRKKDNATEAAQKIIREGFGYGEGAIVGIPFRLIPPHRIFSVRVSEADTDIGTID